MDNKKMLTLEPDEKKLGIETDLDMLSAVDGGNSEDEEVFNAGVINENMLSEEDKELVNQFANEIDIENVNQVVKYGIVAQKNISNFSCNILKKVKNYDLGEVGESLKELTIALDATTEQEKKGIMGIFQKAKRGIDAIKVNYAKAEDNVNRIEKDLKAHQDVLVKDISIYQQMYNLNIEYYKQLTMYIIAGKKALDNAKNNKLSQLKEKAEITKAQEDVQAYNDFNDMCYRFEKKLNDLEITRTISIQTAPQVRLLQNNDREMLDKIQSSISNTIPLWRNQLVLSVGIEHTRRALEAQATLADKTNELLKKNSETLKMATIETAKEAERPIVDIETLKQCNKDLIVSINEVMKIHKQGVIEREKVQVELIKIEEELKETMLQEGQEK